MQKIGEQIVFGARQSQIFATLRDYPPREIDLHVGELHHLGLLGRSTPQHGMNASQQLPGAEGLHYVIVGPDFEQAHFVDFIAYGAHHDQRCFNSSVPQLLAYFYAADSRHSQIHQNEPGLHGQRLLQADPPIARQHSLEAVVFEHQSDGVPEVGIVVNHQGGWHSRATAIVTEAGGHLAQVFRQMGVFTTLLQVGNVSRR